MENVPWGVLWEEGLFLQPHHLQQSQYRHFSEKNDDPSNASLCLFYINS